MIALLIVFLALLLLDLSVAEPAVTGFSCAEAGKQAILRCVYDHGPRSEGWWETMPFLPKTGFGKGLDVTISLGLASLLYGIRHAGMSSKPYLTYTCRKEVCESGDKWVARIRNDGLGPAINFKSSFELVSQPAGTIDGVADTRIDAEAALKALQDTLPGVAFKFHPIGGGGALPKDKEIEVFSVGFDALRMISSFDMVLTFSGQYGHRLRKRVVLVPEVSRRYVD